MTMIESLDKKAFKPTFSPAPGRILVTLVIVVAIMSEVAHGAVVVDTVPVRNAGNPGQVQSQGTFGAVSYSYRMGTFEVTNDQYTAFLNAVAATDTFSLYNSSMESDVRGWILQHGVNGSFTYEVKPNMGNKPVNHVSFWDAARFANWLHNGQPTGAQDDTTTETGAYTLGGVTNPLNTSVDRNPFAKWFIPTEDEWYKAAYHKNDGPTANYFIFPTSSDTLPTIATANGIGDIGNPGANVANYDFGADWNGADGSVTTVGSAGPNSSSPYGTFDQAGNVEEWNETRVTSTSRGARGGSGFSSTRLAAHLRTSVNTTTGGGAALGFRVATVIPEPSSLVLFLVATLCFGLARRRVTSEGW